MAIDLDTLFPGDVTHTRHVSAVVPQRFIDGHGTGASKRKVSTRWRSICSMELRGLDKKEIAAALNLGYATVIRITNDPDYVTCREAVLAEMDSDFFAMKPLAFEALRSGLGSRDENTALRASDQWFKAAGFGGYARDPEPPSRVTAEDIARQLLVGVNVNVTVNQEK